MRAYARVVVPSILVAISLIVVRAQTTDPTTYTVTDLGTLGGRIWSASSVNASSHVVGSSQLGPPRAAYTRAFLWDGSMVDLGTLGGANSDATDINSSGQVVGSSEFIPDGEVSSRLRHAFWHDGTSMYDLGTLGGKESGAFGINDAGTVVGWAHNNTNDTTRAFSWNAGSPLMDLGTLGGTQAAAWAISNAGTIVGWAQTAGDAAIHAFLWEPGTGMIDLGAFPGSSFSVAYGLNESKWVVGYSSAAGNNRAALWQPGAAVRDLGTLPGDYYSYAHDINGAGLIVGQSTGFVPGVGDVPRAVRWTAAGAIEDLNTLIPSTAGWTLRQAFAINDAGQIAGLGIHDGQVRAFLLTPVVPVIASLALTPGTVTGGQRSVGTVTLSEPAPAGGLLVGLASSDTHVATVPAGAAVPEGETSVTFTVKTTPTATDVAVAISASVDDETREATLVVKAPDLSTLTLIPAIVAGCKPVTGKVKLTGKAPAGGVVVTLGNTNPAATVPASVTVPAGQVLASFTIATTPVTSVQTGTVMATYDGGTRNAALKVRPIGVQALGLSPNPVTGGNTVTGTVTLECAAAPAAITVTLSSSNPGLASPAVSSITIPAGSRTMDFTINTVRPAAVSSARIKATANNITKVQTLTVNP